MLQGTYTRLLAVAQFYHFAFLVVSLALLGFGASGSLLSIFPGWYENSAGQSREDKVKLILSISGLGFTLSIGLSYIIINWLPFDSYSIAWDSSQILYFGLYYLGLTIPFVFAGLGIGAALTTSPGKSNKVYAVNLFGSAAGIILALIVLQVAGVPGSILVCGIIGLLAVLTSGGKLPKLGRFLVWGIVISGFAALYLLSAANTRNVSSIGVTISPYKGLSYALRIPGAEKLFGAWNAISRLDVVSGASTRVMPGLSYTYVGNPPPQVGMAQDGDSLQPITLIDPKDFAAADYLPESIAFQLLPMANVMVLESGGGLGLMQALAGGANQVTAVINNQMALDAISQIAFGMDVYSYRNVNTLVESSRAALRSSARKFNIVYLPLSDPYRPVASGAYSLSEDYVLTVESFEEMVSSLSSQGLLVVTRWVQTPPSEALRLFATLIEGLENQGIQNPEDKIIAYRGIQTMTFLVMPAGWNNEQISQVQKFLNERRFDLVWSPSIQLSDVNRFNKLSDPDYYHQFRDLISAESPQDFYSEYPFSIHPATDNSPFFFHFFKWEQTPEIIASFGRVWQPFGGSGYFVLVALLFLVVLLSSLLIILPLILRSRRSAKSRQDGAKNDGKTQKIATWRVFIYFGCIGIAFLFLEIPIIQKSILSMEHPIYAFTLVVLTILIFSSMGSLISPILWNSRRWILTALFILSILTPIWMSLIQDKTLGWSLIPRSMVLGFSLAPMGFLMGVPFPTGLKWLEKAESKLVPWAWAVNGCASVIAAVLAAILVLSTSFSVVLVIGAIFYGMAALVLKD
jgi:hypothetical protein